MVTNILNVNLTLINIMENYLISLMLISVLILLISLTISFIIFISDYRHLKEKLEIVSDILDTCKEVINLDYEINQGVKAVCNQNNGLIKKLIFITDENNDLRQIINSNDENNEK